MNFSKAEFVRSAASARDFPRDGLPRVIFAGRSNVGKSSSINCLLQRKNFARVSAVPGKTVFVNLFLVDKALWLVDLPGYGYAKVSRKEKERWAGLIGDYLASDRDIALVFQLIDMRHAPTKEDLMMIDYLVECEMPFVIVLTKMDKLTRRQQEERLQSFQREIPYADQITMLPVSSETGEGMEAVREIIEQLCLPDAAQPDPALADAGEEEQEAIRRFRESVRSGRLDECGGEKLPARERKKGETCL